MTTNTETHPQFPAKVVVVGWDGADWRLLGPWMQQGKLPTLARLVHEGVSGSLRSTIRPESSVAWASFSTGVNPGKHGIYGFAGRKTPTDYAMPLTNASSVRVERFWDILGRRHRVGLLNVPYTYPPSPVNGFLVAGMLTPSAESEFTYPPALKSELLDSFSGYITDVSGPKDDKARLIENVRVFTAQQQAMALYLLTHKPWDFFTVVFVGSDRLQHFLWADGDPAHPWHEDSSPFADELLTHYQALDDGLAQILDAIPADTRLFLISDHGFNGCARKFLVNHWLHRQGYLATNAGGGSWPLAMALVSRLSAVPLLRTLKQKVARNHVKLSDLRSASFVNTIDWHKTSAYFGLDGGVRINLQGREPEGIVSPGQAYEQLRRRLRQELSELRDPDTQQQVFAQIILREEIYEGPHLELAPDLILEPQRERSILGENFVLDGALHADKRQIFVSSAPYSGNHAFDGIFCAVGSGIHQDRRVDGAQIVDLAPTILTAMGHSVPAHMDGKPLDIFSSEITPHILTEPSVNPDTEQQIYNQEEAALVEKRLRDLGYI